MTEGVVLLYTFQRTAIQFNEPIQFVKLCTQAIILIQQQSKKIRPLRSTICKKPPNSGVLRYSLYQSRYCFITYCGIMIRTFIYAYNLSKNTRNFRRCIELPFTFSTFSSKISHKVFICIAYDIIAICFII